MQTLRNLLLFFLLFPTLAFSSDYTWHANRQNLKGTGSTPSEAVSNLSSSYYVHSCVVISKTKADCWFDTVSPPTKFFYQDVFRLTDQCPDGHDFNFDNGKCEPEEPEEPEQCEAGNEVSHWKFFGKNTLYNIPPTACLVGCRYNHTSSTPCMGPVESNGAVGNSCKMTYTGTGEECSGGNDSPPDDEPPGPEAEENPDCKKFTNVDGSWGFDCSPKPDPDEENNSCPPGYMMQGDTCFRIPPEHPDYDPDKDPENPGNGDGGNGGNNGEGDENGDWAKESTLQGIDKTLKDIDKTGKAIESAMKTGNATTHDLLRGIKDAIGNIPGGGGGNGNGTGSGDGDGEGEGDGLTEPEGGSFDEAIAEYEEAIDLLKEQVQERFDRIKLFKIPGLQLSEGGGTLPSFSFSTKHFGSHEVDLNHYAEPLSVLGSGFVFVCGFLALVIIFVRT